MLHLRYEATALVDQPIYRNEKSQWKNDLKLRFDFSHVSLYSYSYTTFKKSLNLMTENDNH